MRVNAQLMRYGHQDFFRLTGRDPVKQPLTILERVILLACIAEQVEAEFKPREGSDVGESFSVSTE
jgi:hypothetical protein